METFSSRIKSLRNGLTYKAFEQVTGIPAATLQYLEKTNADIKGGQIIKLCQCFGKSADWLLGLDTAKQSTVSARNSVVAINGHAINSGGIGGDCANCPILKAAAKKLNK